jgi:hypothetical protein
MRIPKENIEARDLYMLSVIKTEKITPKKRVRMVFKLFTVRGKSYKDRIVWEPKKYHLVGEKNESLYRMQT